MNDEEMEEYLDYVSEINPEALKIDGFNDAIIGMVSRCGEDDYLLYDYDKLIDILVKQDGMSREEAIDYIEYNILGAYMGCGTPFIASLIENT